MSQYAGGTQRRRRLWSSRLWILVAILGAATVYSMVVAVHDDRDARNAAHVVVVTAGMQIAERANHRLEVLALKTFAPVLQAGIGGDALAELVHEQEVWAKCACRLMLPAVAFFRYDVVTHGVKVAKLADTSRLRIEDTSAFAAVALEHASAPHMMGLQATRLSTDKRLGEFAVVTMLQPNTSGKLEAVFGAVARRQDVAELLFKPEVLHSTSTATNSMALLDTMSLRVSTHDSVVLFGALDSLHRSLRVRVPSIGPLHDVGIDVAFSPDQLVHRRLMMPMRAERLWPLGALTLATILVTAIAIGTARRETLLARARSDFIAGVSHDLRMPLAQILLAGETLSLQRERNDAERVTFANSIVREARRLVGLVDNVLLFSRTGAVELKPVLQPVPVDELFADVIESVELAVKDGGQTIVAATAGDSAVLGDRALLRQALANLVDNAIKYGKTGQQIRLGIDATGAGVVRLLVDDDGPGVPQSERKAVFERYERLQRDLGSERTGSGIGLSVVSQIARACQGRAWLTDAPSGGARAVLELQRANANADAHANANTNANAKARPA